MPLYSREWTVHLGGRDAEIATRGAIVPALHKDRKSVTRLGLRAYLKQVASSTKVLSCRMLILASSSIVVQS